MDIITLNLPAPVVWMSTCICIRLYSQYKEKQKCMNDVSSDDDCNSLYYDTHSQPSGRGFPFTNTTDQLVVKRLKEIKHQYVRLPSDLYGEIVRNIPVVCVDIVCQRMDDKKLLLFLRRDKPASDIWWWPGGRMFKGETFFDAAVRKVRDETGDKDITVVPRDILGVWNTFFPDSSWDTKENMGCQTVNITVFCEVHKITLSPAHKANSAWAVSDQRWISVNDALEEGKYDKYVRLNVEIARKKKLL
jgi:colanic acid biosynthesis protein WcaH